MYEEGAEFRGFLGLESKNPAGVPICRALPPLLLDLACAHNPLKFDVPKAIGSPWGFEPALRDHERFDSLSEGKPRVRP